MAENRIRSWAEIVAAAAADRISELPDSIIAHILSFLSSSREAVRTSILSKRWRCIWTSVPVLIIDEQASKIRFLSRHPSCLEHCSNSYYLRFFSSVERTLACRGDNKLQKFAFVTDKWHWEHDSSHVNRWISYAISCNVEELEICGHCLLPNLPQKLFQNSCLKKLSLDYCDWNPNLEINLENLISLRLAHGHVNRESISKLLSGSPSLETFELASCRGSNGLNITSTRLRKLIVNGRWLSDGIEIRAPNILSLEIKGYIKSEIMLMDVGSVVEATLDFDTKRVVTLKRMIESLKHVNELKIGPASLHVLMSLEMKNGSSPISRFKYLEINVVKGKKEIKCLAWTPQLVCMNERASFFTHPNESEDNEIMRFVLENASVLEKVVIRVSPECDPVVKRLQSLLKLRGFILASEEEFHFILEKLK